MTTGKSTPNHLITELPIRLYSALRTIRIYPPKNPQVKKSTDLVLTILAGLQEHAGDDITIASSEKTVLVNGTLLSEKDQQRPQIKGIADLFANLQIHTLTFHHGFSAADCVHFLQILATATSSIQPGQPLKILLQEAGIQSISVDEKRYVAVHEGEQVVPDNSIGFGGEGYPITGDIAEYLRGNTPTPEEMGKLSSAALQQLFSASVSENHATGQHSGGQNALHALINSLNDTTSASIKDTLLDNSSTALADLAPAKLSQLFISLPAKQTADELLNKTVQRLDYEKLEALLLHLSAASSASGDKQEETNGQHVEFTSRLRKSPRGGEIENAMARVNDARTLAGLSRQPTPPHLREQMQQPEWSASILVPALRYLVGQQQDGMAPELFINLLTRYELDLTPPVRNQVANMAGARLATLQDQELSRVLTHNFKGTFGGQLYDAVIAQMSDNKFEQIAQELNLLSQRKQTSSSASENEPDFAAAYTDRRSGCPDASCQRDQTSPAE